MTTKSKRKEKKIVNLITDDKLLRLMGAQHLDDINVDSISEHPFTKKKIWVYKRELRKPDGSVENYVCACVTTPNKIYLYNQKHGMVIIDKSILENPEESGVKLGEVFSKLPADEVNKMHLVIRTCAFFDPVEDEKIKGVIGFVYGILRFARLPDLKYEGD